MADEGRETFEVSAQGKERQSGSEGKFLHITIVDHNPIVEGTDEMSFVDLRIPVPLVESGLKMIPAGKLGNIDPTLLVQMVEMGAVGEIIKINEEKKTISIRVE